jgi:uncharacterized protein (DUF58 family)
MNLSQQGTILAWFALAMTIVSAVFQNPPILAVVMVAVVFLILQAVRFNRQMKTLRNKLTVRVEPETTTTSVSSSFKFEASLSNPSPIEARVADFELALPAEIHVSSSDETKKRLLARKSFLSYNFLAQALSPGLFRASSASISVEDRTSLFTDILRIRCNVIIEVIPKLTEPEEKIETSDPRRLGAGTEVAGLREATTEDDFRVIDWKSTARTGRYMTKEFLRELTPPAIIVVNRSSLRQSGRSHSNVLDQVAGLTVSFSSSTRVGLIIFDDRNIVANFAPSAGQQSRLQMINALVLASGQDARSVPGESVTRSYQELMNTVRIMKASTINRPRRTIDVFTRNLLPYYENTLSNYHSKLWGQGSFQALMEILKLQQPAFVIVIMGSERDLSGICEGSAILSQAGHRLILSIISSPREGIPSELLRLRLLGVILLQSNNVSGLLSGIRTEARASPRIRTQNLGPR